MQSVAEFVKQCLDLGESHQRRLTRRRHRQVQVICNDRTDFVAIYIRCTTVAAHPGATSFRITCVHVRHKQTQVRAVRIFDVVGGYNGVPCLDFHRFEHYAEQPISHLKRTATNFFETEVRHELAFVQIESRFAHFFRVVPPIVARQLEFITGQVLHIRKLGFRTCQSGPPDAQQKFFCFCRSLRHTRFKLIMRV